MAHARQRQKFGDGVVGAMDIENIPKSRILIITDRRELEDQINDVFAQTNIHLERAKSGADLLDKLGKPEFSLLSALVHKFGRHNTAEELTQYLNKLQKNPPPVGGECFCVCG